MLSAKITNNFIHGIPRAQSYMAGFDTNLHDLEVFDNQHTFTFATFGLTVCVSFMLESRFILARADFICFDF